MKLPTNIDEKIELIESLGLEVTHHEGGNKPIQVEYMGECFQISSHPRTLEDLIEVIAVACHRAGVREGENNIKNSMKDLLGLNKQDGI